MKTLIQTSKAALALMLAALCLVLLLPSGAQAAGNIGVSKAKEIAAEHAGFTVSTVKFIKAKLDRDDGAQEYEIDFTKDGYKYEYDIDAQSGAIVEYGRQLTKKARNNADTSRYIGVGKAKQAALDHAGLKAADVTFTKEKLDKGRTGEYEIEFYTASMKYEYDIDALSGAVNEYTHKAVKSAQTGNTGSSSNAGSGTSTAYIGVDRAKEIALSHAGLGAAQVRFTKAKLERDDGIYVYDIEFVKDGLEYEYEIDAKTGKILECDIDRD